MEKNYFKNKLLIIYPFHSLNINNNGEYEGLNFKGIDILQYPNLDKDKIEIEPPLEDFLSNLFPIIFNQRLEKPNYIGYSIHEYHEAYIEKEKNLEEIQRNINYLYYAFYINDSNINTNFPKYYVVDFINQYFDQDFKYSFRITEELIKETDQYRIIGHKDRKEYLLIKDKASNIYIPGNFNKIQKYFESNLKDEIYWAIHWFNQSVDEKRTLPIKIITGVIALENLLEMEYPNADCFIYEIKRELSLNSIVKKNLITKIPFLTNHLKAAHQARSGIVHGKEFFEYAYENKNIRYSPYSFYLQEVFKIILNKRLGITQFFKHEVELLLERVFPNRRRFDEIGKQIKNNKASLEDTNIIDICKKLIKLRENDYIGVEIHTINQISSYINSISDKSISYKLNKLPILKTLIKDEKLIFQIEDDYDKLYDYLLKPNFNKIGEYLILEGISKFMSFLYHYAFFRKRINDQKES